MSSLILRPQTLVLDSSVLATMSDDFSKESKRKDVLSVLAAVDDLNFILVLTAHQAFELLRHGNEAKAEQRLRFLVHLGSRPRSAWVSSIRRQALGSILDIVAAEILVLQTRPEITLQQLLSEVRERVLRFGPLPLDDFSDLRLLRKYLAPQMERERQIVSLVRADLLIPGDERVGDLRKLGARSREEATALLSQYVPALTGQLKRHGEKRLTEVDSLASTFYSDVAGQVPDLTGYVSPFDGLLDYLGLDPEEVPDEMTFHDVAFLGVFREQLKVLAEVLDVPLATVTGIDPVRLPSWRVQRALRKRQRTADRASGGDLTDADLAVLVWYFDHTIVDRRTNEYLRQICRDEDGLGMQMNRWSKVSRYHDLPSVLTAFEGATTKP